MTYKSTSASAGVLKIVICPDVVPLGGRVGVMPYKSFSSVKRKA